MNKGAVKKKETLIAIAQFYASDEFYESTKYEQE